MAAAAATKCNWRGAFALAIALLPATHLSAPPVLASPDRLDRQGIRWGGYPVSSFSSDLGYTLGALAQRFDYGSGTEPGVGKRPFESLLTLQTTYSTRGPRDLFVEREAFLGPGPGSARWSAGLYAMESRFAHYYGLGAGSLRQPSLEASGFYLYNRRLLTLHTALRKQLPELGGVDLQAGLGYTLTQSQAEQDSQYQRDFGPGRTSLSYSKLLLQAIWEKRDSEFIPSQGMYGLASIATAPLSGWSRLDLDYRRYLPILDQRRLWLATQIRYTASSPEAPLNEKARLGSLGTLRGLPGNRYLSNHSASLRLEARSMWFGSRILGMPFKLGSGLYTDLGKISEHLTALAASPLRPAWGLALFGSYFTDDFLGSADFGFSPGATSVYLQLGHAF